MAVAKGQKRSGREAKKPKKTDADRLKQTQAATVQSLRLPEKAPPRKA
jgi:hypothetical protein